MSYILDALKKSEKERSLGNVPTLGASGRDEERGIPLRWFVLTVVFLVVAIVAGGGWMVWSSRHPDLPVAGVVQTPTAAPAASSGIEPATTRPQVQPAEQATVASPVPVYDLDGAIRSRIPDLRINVLSYSESRPKRFIMVGQEIFKEGEEVAAGVLVEEIRSSDVVFRFEDVRFTLEP